MSKNTGTSELINYFDLGVNGDVGIAGSLDINTIANATTDTDTFLVSDTGIIKYRTGAQLLSDIGAAPAVAGGYVPYTGATTNVDLGVYNLTASAIIANGSGSNSGIVHLESNAIHSLVNGYGSIASGTTNQFNLYQTTGAGVFRGAILSLNSITEFATRTFTLPDADGTLALTSSLGAYLPLAGGTLTGALNGTSASFTSDIRSNANYRDYQNESLMTTNGSVNEFGSSGAVTPRSVTIFAGNATALSIATNRVATFSNNIFSGGSVLSSPSGADTIIGAYGAQDCSLILQDAVQLWELYVNDDFYINRGSTNVLSLNRTTGAATFSSSVTIAASTFLNWGARGGISQDGSFNFNWSTNGVANAFHLQSATGNVGIGITNPTFTLHAKAASGSTTGLRLESSGGTTNFDILSSEGDGNAYLYQRSNYGILIGTNNTLRMTITAGGVLRLNAQATYGSLTYEQTIQYATSPAGIFFGNSFNSNNNVALQLRTSNDGTGVQAMTLTSGGNVLIGTTTDGGYKLDVTGTIRSLSATPLVVSMTSNPANDAVIAARWTSGVGMEMRYFPDFAQGFVDNTYQVTAGQPYGDIYFRQNVSGTMTTRMTIKADGGRVGIGTTNPAGRLSVNDAVYGEYLRVATGVIGGNQTSVFIAWNNGGNITLQQVVVGAADSGGSGFRLLRIPNT